MPAEFHQAEDCPRQGKPFELKGGHVLAMIVAFFAVVVAVNATMMTVALRTMPGLDARNGYDPSQAYNREIAAARAQAARGWRADGQVSLRGEVAHVAVALADREGQALPGAIVTARLKHPTDRRRDHEVALVGRTTVFEGDAAGVSEGFWDFVIEVRETPGGPAHFVSRQRIRLKG
jgi:nitrogen fixation protein FixH